jgi:antitoxin MazE
MVKRLTKIGNSYGVIIDKPILELLKIDRDTALEISTDGEALVLRPIRGDRAIRMREAIEQIGDDHAEAFEKLAK